MAFGSNNDMDIQVKVDASGAIRILDSLGNEIKKVEGAAKSAGTGFSSFQKSIITLNQGLGLAKTAFTGVSKAVGGIADTLERGSAVNDVNKSFQDLSITAGKLADTYLNDLNEATGETIANFDLQRKAIEAVRAGAKPKEFLELAKASRALAEQAGGSTVEALDELSRAFETGQTRMLKNKLGVIDLGKAEAELAKKLDVASNLLSREGQVQAARTAILEYSRKKTEEVGAVTKDAGDNIAQFGKIVTDAKDKVFSAVEQNVSLNKSLEELKTLIATTDFTPLINFLSKTISLATQAASALTSMATAARNASNPFNQIQAKSAEFQNSLKSLREQLKKVSSQDGVAAVAKGIVDLEKRMRSMGELTDEAAGQLLLLSRAAERAAQEFQGPVAPLEKLNENLIDQEKAAEEARKAQEKHNEELKKARELYEKLNSADGISEYASKINQVDKLHKDGIITLEKYNEEIEKLRNQFKSGGGDVGNFDRALAQIGIEAAQKAADEARDQLMAAYEDAVNFYGEIWSEIIHTGTFDLSRALKEVAVGFAAQMTAAMLGIPGFSSFGGLGQGLAGNLLGGSGGLGGIAGFAGGAGLLSGTSAGGFISGLGGNVGPVASGAEYSGMLAGAGPAGWAALATAAVLAVGSQTEWFGLEGGMSAGQRERADIRDRIAGLAGTDTFNGQNLFGIDFHQFDESIPILEEARKELEGLALVLTQGSEQADEFQKIFAILVTGFKDGVVETNDLNAAMLEAGKFMNQLGLTSEDAKAQLLALFKQGEITSEQFASGLESLNRVAEANLLSIQDYFYQTFGPQAQQLLESLRVAGIGTWQDIAGASVDQIAVMIQELNKLGIEAEQVLSILSQADVVQANTPETPAPAPSYGGSSGAGSSSASRSKPKRKKSGIAGDIFAAIEASKEYQDVLASLNADLITEAQATDLLNGLYKEGRELLKAREEAQKRYNRAIKEGGKNTGEYAKDLAAINKQIRDLGGGEGSNAQSFNQGLLDFVKEFGDNLAAVNLAAIAAGSSFAAMRNEAIKAFLAGKTTAAQAKKELLSIGPGLPDVEGGVAQLVQQISTLGLQGGALSLNALRGLGQETLEVGGTDLESLISTGLAGGASRGQLQDIVIALQNAGVTTLEQIRDLSDEAGISILANLQDLGFIFGETSSGVSKLLEDLAAIPESKDIDVRLNISAGDIDATLQRILDLFGVDVNAVLPGYGDEEDTLGSGGGGGGDRNRRRRRRRRRAGGHLSA